MEDGQPGLERAHCLGESQRNGIGGLICPHIPEQIETELLGSELLLMLDHNFPVSLSLIWFEFEYSIGWSLLISSCKAKYLQTLAKPRKSAANCVTDSPDRW